MGTMNGIFHNTSLLNQNDFQNLLGYKDDLVNKRDKSIVINQDGTVQENTDHKVFMGSIVNYKFDIDTYEKYIGNTFTNLMYHIKQWLESNNLADPKPYMVRCYRNNQVTYWHKHGMLPGILPKNHWVVIYYMHPNWDISYGGQLNVSLVENEPMYKFETTSNSIICHNGYYGHGVDNLKLGYEGDRDLFLSHWVTK
jgi:hypothetical protein